MRGQGSKLLLSPLHRGPAAPRGEGEGSIRVIIEHPRERRIQRWGRRFPSAAGNPNPDSDRCGLGFVLDPTPEPGMKENVLILALARLSWSQRGKAGEKLFAEAIVT